jgi:hypothetical protein
MLFTQRKYKESLKKFTWAHTQTLSFSCNVEDLTKKERKLTTRNGNNPPPPNLDLKFQIKDKLEFINNHSSLFKGCFHIKKFHPIYF